MYIINLSFVTKRRATQIKIIIDHSLNATLISTIRFINFNDYLSFNVSFF